MEFDIIGAMNRVKQLNAKLCSDVTKQYDLSQMELEILLFLSTHTQMDTASDFAEIRGVAKSNTSKAVNNLVNRGLILTTVDSANRRMQHLSLTSDANEITEKILKCQQRFVETVITGFSHQELVTLLEYFVRIDNNVKAALSD